MTLDLITLLPWSAPKTVSTARGERLLRTATPTDTFWAAWRDHSESLRAAGISPSKQDGEWAVCWWTALDPAADAARVAAETARRERERANLADALAGKQACLPPDCEARLATVTPKLLPYQVASVRRQVRAVLDYGAALDASDTGTGKTYVTLAAAYVLDRPVMVVCPKAVRPAWLRAAAHVGVEKISVSNYELLRRGTCPELTLAHDPKGKKIFTWRLPESTVVVFDECHRMKDSKTQNCALGLAALRQKFVVLALSATSADNPMQMKFAALVTGLVKHEREFFPWMMRNGVSRGRWGMEWDGKREHLARIHQSIFPLHGTRIRIRDLGDQFPETQITAEAYDLNGEGRKVQAAYDEMAEEIARIQASEITDKQACILTARLRARQRSEVLKVPAIADMVRDAVEEGMSVAVFVNFDDSIEALGDKLATICTIRGGQSAPERQAWIDRFNVDQEHVILCNIKAGGVAVSLHGSATARMRLAIICPTDSGQDLKQAFGRVWRANGARSIQRVFFAAGTIEEPVCRNVNAKISRIDLLNDGIPDEILTVGGVVDYAGEAEKRLSAAHRDLRGPSMEYRS
jgi:superfamily II DNA or RNA helicase